MKNSELNLVKESNGDIFVENGFAYIVESDGLQPVSTPISENSIYPDKWLLSEDILGEEMTAQKIVNEFKEHMKDKIGTGYYSDDKKAEQMIDGLTCEFPEKNMFYVKRNFACRAEMEDLEEKGWDFNDLYEQVMESQKEENWTFEQAKKYEQENHCIFVQVYKNGGTSYDIVQKAHFGNEYFHQGDTGDDEATIQDLEQLMKEGKLWNCENGWEI